MNSTKKYIVCIFLMIGMALGLAACEEKPPVKKEVKPTIVKKKIIQPPKSTAKPAAGKTVQPQETKEDKSKNSPPSAGELEKADQEKKKQVLAMLGLKEEDKTEHYDSKGKIDPFKALIQQKSEENKLVQDNRPKRILTPLEKIALSQIRLVAVIQMKNKNIAMVEEASGKGYEVSVGTYIGKKQGRITEITSDSIVVKELVADYKGRLKEQIQEIKLNKNSGEE